MPNNTGTSADMLMSVKTSMSSASWQKSAKRRMRRLADRPFQTRAPATTKLSVPSTVLVHGITRDLEARFILSLLR